MKLVSALKKSKKVIKKKTEMKRPTWLNVQIAGEDCVMTPRGAYRFSLRTIEIDLKKDYVLSLVRESYDGKKIEKMSNIMTKDPEAIALWINERKKAILNRDFSERKYMLPHYEI